MKYESTFNAIDKILRNEAGCSNELDYIEQTSWLLFLKYLDDGKSLVSSRTQRVNNVLYVFSEMAYISRAVYRVHTSSGTRNCEWRVRRAAWEEQLAKSVPS